jgi:hypothetical protein
MPEPIPWPLRTRPCNKRPGPKQSRLRALYGRAFVLGAGFFWRLGLAFQRFANRLCGKVSLKVDRDLQWHCRARM